MSLITLENVAKSYGPKLVLADASFAVAKGEKMALVGYNGTGKSTLLKMICGIVVPDYGKIKIAKGATIAYLPQAPVHDEAETVGEHLRRISGMDAEEAGTAHRFSGILSELGLGGIAPDRPVRELSGGQKAKLAVAGAVLKDADLLLLDEPTNNLDLPALVWFEKYLAASDKACVIVSHDREFLDRVVNKVAVIDWHSRVIKIYGGCYSDFLEEEKRRREYQSEAYEREQEEKKRLESSAREKRAEAVAGTRWKGNDKDKLLRGFKRNRAIRSAKSAKAMEKRAERAVSTEKPALREEMSIPIAAELGRSVEVVRLEDAVAGYGSGFRIAPVNLQIAYGERVCVIGENGSGKSTLLKLITGRLEPLCGKVRVDSRMRLGDLMQEHENLPAEKAVVDFLMAAGGLERDAAYRKAYKFGLPPDQSESAIGELSPGQKTRLLLALFSVRSANILVLDEPTNHLDLEAMEALEEALAQYRGTVIAVSHDRRFMRNLAPDRILEMKDGMIIKK